jgi:hypothetical protein
MPERSRTVQSDRLVKGVTFAEGELWHGAIEAGQAELRRVEASSGEVLEALALPDAFLSGLPRAELDRDRGAGVLVEKNEQPVSNRRRSSVV